MMSMTVGLHPVMCGGGGNLTVSSLSGWGREELRRTNEIWRGLAEGM
jgi:hypothetical protein